MVKRGLGFVILLLSVSLLATGCLGFLTGTNEVLVSGEVTVDGAAPGELEVQVAVKGTAFKKTVSGEGKFQFNLVPRTYELTATAEGLEPATVSITVQKNKPLAGVKIAMSSVEDPEEPEEPEEPEDPLLYLEIDFGNPEHVALLEKPWDSVLFEVKDDPFGDAALFFPKGTAAQAPPEGYKLMRFALIDTPDVVDTFKLSLEQIGEGGEDPPKDYPHVSGGNRSLSLVFGYEDVNNWWVVYYTYTDATRIARMKDGVQDYICRPMITDQWLPSNAEYQLAEIELKRVGDQMVVSAYANGIPVSDEHATQPVHGCTFAAEDYTPGKIGIGGYSTSGVQSWYFQNVVLEETL